MTRAGLLGVRPRVGIDRPWEWRMLIDGKTGKRSLDFLSRSEGDQETWKDDQTKGWKGEKDWRFGKTA